MLQGGDLSFVGFGMLRAYMVVQLTTKRGCLQPGIARLAHSSLEKLKGTVGRMFLIFDASPQIISNIKALPLNGLRLGIELKKEKSNISSLI